MSTDSGKSTQAWNIVARCAEEFIAAWEEGGEPPSLEDHLVDLSASLEGRVLIELIKIDLEYRWQRDLPVPSLEEYLSDHPERLEGGEPPAELIQEDSFLRRRYGSPEALEEWVLRYPAHAETVNGAILVGERTEDASARRPEISNIDLQTPTEPFGRYGLIEKIGEGGMGEVWKAWDPAIDRVVALKMILDSEERGAVERFRREVRLASRLRHPNILPIFDVGCHEGTHYLTTIHVEGQDLHLSVGDDLSIEDRIEIVIRIARGLDHAHERGVLHRDVKPGNILLDG